MDALILEFTGALLVGGVSSWVVSTRFGAVGRLVMVLIVPIVALAAVPALADAVGVGVERGCTYECWGRAAFIVPVYVGLVLGIVLAATAVWLRQRRVKTTVWLVPPR